MIFHVLLILSVFVSNTGEGATAAYTPTDVFLFNCGATSNADDVNGRNWTVEQWKIISSNSNKASFSLAALNQGSVPRVPYIEARIFQSAFTYNFQVSPGWKFLRLYFYPTRYGSGFDAKESFFSVTVNGFTLLKNFSSDSTAMASKPESKSLIKEFIIPVNKTLNLTFTPSPNSFGFVNGIEIVSMPDRFYTKGGFDNSIKSIGSTIDYQIDNSTAFETVHRLNVGGNMINDVSDSGMFRRWLADDDYRLSENSGIEVYRLDVKINYTAKTPAYVAPEYVYITSREMGNAKYPNLNLLFNLTWLFKVDARFSYLVRLHFCETLEEVTETGQRIFSIFIGNQTAKTEMDVIYFSGGSRIPIYLDFNIYVGQESGPDLRLELHPCPDVNPQYYDVILNGVEILKQNDSEGSLAGPNPTPLQQNPTPNSLMIPKRKGNKPHVLAIILGVIGSAIVLAMFVVFIIMKKKKKKNDFSVNTTSKPTDSVKQTRLTTSLPSDLNRRFSILEIRSATNNFEENLIIGVGGFGPVYKGRIDGGDMLVAVKRLNISSSQGAKEFETEVKMLSILRHIHLVSLIGYCDDENEMVLVYEYMPRGTVKDHLYKRNKVLDPPLSWKQRLEICIGAARGLQYLHTGLKHTIIHRDIKTTNILLDDNYVAKVSDFGLSTTAFQSHVSTLVKGTFGYIDPEYYRRQVLTEKSDIYSFGVVLLEVLCCRPIKIQNIPPEEGDLIMWMKLNYEKGTIDQIVDSDLMGDITSNSLEKFCEIAVRCVQDCGIERPSMNDVVWTLEFALQLHETCKKKNDDVESYDLTKRVNENLPRLVDSAPLIGDESSGSSWGVFSEI